MPTEWYLSTPKYFSGGESQIMDDAQSGFLELLEVSPESYVVEVNGIENKVIVQQDDDHNDVKKVLSVIGTLVIGDIIKHKNIYWLVNFFVDDNRMYDQCLMSMCDTTLKMVGKPIKRKVGVEPISNKPIYEETVGEVFTSRCILTNKLSKVTTASNAINLPKGMFLVQIPYTDNAMVKEGNTVKMYNREYRILDVDYGMTTEFDSGVTRGIIELFVERVIE